LSIIVQIHEDGAEKYYFRIVEEDNQFFAERPDKYSVKLESTEEDIYSLVITALETMKRKDTEWKAIMTPSS